MDKIICVGKNYVEHAQEMSKLTGEALAIKPVLFLKPPSAAVYSKNKSSITVELPKNRGSVHPECEIVVRLNAKGEIDAVTLGLDMTLRDEQTELKKKGQPWEVSKVFAGSAIIGPWVEVVKFREWLGAEFTLKVDGTLRQKGQGSEMTMKPVDCVAHARAHFPICEGDVIFTGTPAGVAAVVPGSKAELSFGEIQYSVLWK